MTVLMGWLFAAAALCGLLALLALRRPPRRRRGPASWLTALVMLVLALALAALGVALRQFERLGTDHPVATLHVTALGPQRFRVELDRGDGDPRSYELLGDQWQLDARVLRWRLPALLAGAPPLYRLERLSGRYADIVQEREATRSVHALDEGTLAALPDLFDLKRTHPRWLPFVDARYGSAAYLPLLDGARYEVSFNPRGGLVAHPANAETERMLEASGW